MNFSIKKLITLLLGLFLAVKIYFLVNNLLFGVKSMTVVHDDSFIF